MLAQFQTRYPTSSLLSELLSIYQGKFIVRASIQIEGVVRATGMAIAETIELAEDRARERAMEVLLAAPESAPEVLDVPITPPQAQIADRAETSPPSDRSAVADDFFTPATPQLEVEPATPTFTDYPEFAPTDTSELFSLTAPEPDFASNSVAAFSNVKPFVPRSAKEEIPEKIELTAAKIKPEVSEPIDLTDTEFAIDNTLKNLRWTAEQERKYLKRTYSQESRQALTTQQLFEFLSYLELFAQTSKELERLGWTNQQGKEYLLRTYNKQSRQYLSYQELKEFLEYLQAEPS